MKKQATLLGIIVLVLAACGPAATPTVSPTVAPTRAVATPAMAPTSAPAATRLPSTPTATPAAIPTKPATGAPRSGGILSYALKQTVSTWNTLGSPGLDHQAVGFMYNRLENRSTGAPACDYYPMEPSLMVGWRFLDSTTVELRLRPGVRFHNRPPVNGRELLAEDVIYNLVTLGDKSGKAIPDANKLIQRAQAVDKYTARIYLKEPGGIFPTRITHDRNHIFAPEAVGEDLAIASPEEHLGTGPFMFGSQKPGVSVTLKRNPDYWESGLPYVDGINILIIPDASTRVAGFRSGQLDLIHHEPFSLIQPLTKAPGVIVQKCPDFNNYALALRSDKPPFNDVRVRRAVSMAIDRQVIVDLVYQGGRRTYAPFPSFSHPSYMDIKDYPAEVQKYFEYNPAAAKRLLTEAGYPNGFETEYNLDLYPHSARLGEAVSSMLQQVGVAMKLRAWDKLARDTARRTLRLEGISEIPLGGEPPIEQATRHYNWVRGEPHWSTFGYRNEKLLGLLEAGFATGDPAQLDKVLKELQVLFASEMFNVPLVAPDQYALMQPYVRNVYFKPFYLYNIWDFMYKVWLDR